MPNGQKHPKCAHDQRRLGSDSVTEELRHRTQPSNGPTPEIEIAGPNRHSDTDQNLPPSSAQGSIQLEDEDLTYYPAYCHKASPTWFEWVKLTAYDIHTRLHIQDGYHHSWLTEYRYGRDAPQLMFYRNHPVQFVQVVGIVVSFDEHFDRFWLFTIDDSSGLTIDVVCRKPTKENSGTVYSSFPSLDHQCEDETDEVKEILQLSNLVAGTVELGSVLQVKGVVTLFRRNQASSCTNDLKSNTTFHHTQKEKSVRQISLQRLAKVHDTNQEINLIAARTRFYKSILSQPWNISKKEQEKLRREALGEVEHDKKRARKAVLKRQRRVEMEKEDTAKIQQDYKREDVRREQDAEAARQAGQRLKQRLEQKSMQGTEQIPPKSAASLSIVKSGKRKDRDKRRNRKWRKDDALGGRASQVGVLEQHDTTNESFGPLEDEKSALLRLAFG